MISLENIKPSSAFTIISGVFALFTVELMIYLLSPQRFLQLDLIRLCGVGIGILAPIMVSNILFFRVADSRTEDKKGDKDDDEKLIWSLASFFLIVKVSFVTLISYPCNLRLSTALWILLAIEILVQFIGWVSSAKGIRLRQNTEKIQ